jgi:hypothetical protein
MIDKKSFVSCAKNNLVFSIYFSVISSILLTSVSIDRQIVFSTTKLLLVALVIHSIIFVVSTKLRSLSKGIAIGLILLVLPALQAFLGPIISCVWWFVAVVVVGRNWKQLVMCLRHTKTHVYVLPCCVLLCAIVLSGQYTSFNIVQRLHWGDVHQDTLYHGALSAMIKTYGVPSIGLAGLVPIKYHWLSHAVFAAISNISDVDIMTVISVVPVLVFAPIIVGLLTASIFAVPQVGDRQYWIVMSFISTILGCATCLLRHWGVYLNNWIVSESYSLALIPFVSYLLIGTYENANDRSVLTRIILTFLCTLSKGPVGLAIVVIQSGRCLRRDNRSEIIPLFACLVGFVLASFLVIGGNKLEVDPLSFPQTWYRGRHFISASTLPVGLLVVLVGSALHFILPLVSLALVRSKLITVENRYFTSDMVCLLIYGLMAILLLRLGGANEVYFSLLAWVCSIPYFALFIYDVTSRLFQRKNLLQVLLIIATLSVGIILERRSVMQFAGRMTTRSTNNKLVVKLLEVAQANDHKVNDAQKFGYFDLNPIKRCSARPFLYPAVSETAWTNVIEVNPGPCEYYAYGYDDYHPSILKDPLNTVGQSNKQ